MVHLNNSDADKVLRYLRKELERENNHFEQVMKGKDEALKSDKKTEVLLAQLADELGFSDKIREAHNEIVSELSQMILLLTEGSSAA